MQDIKDALNVAKEAEISVKELDALFYAFIELVQFIDYVRSIDTKKLTEIVALKDRLSSIAGELSLFTD